MSQLTQLTQGNTRGLGNTKPNPEPKVLTRGRKWCLTLNNYTEEEYKHIYDTITQDSLRYVIGKEGDEKTPHLQIYVHYKNAIAFKTLKKRYSRAHIEKAKGNEDQNLKYCSKEGNFITNIEEKIPFKTKLEKLCLQEYDNITWKGWQKEIIELVNTKPDSRTINWYWSIGGSKGKSYLCKYLAIKEDALICNGKQSDVFNQINTYIENEKIPRIILLDIPRHNIEYLNYGCIESIKNGCLYSGKYEGGRCIYPYPHVIIFANSEPIEEKLSKDRWNIVDIEAFE